MEPIEDTEKNSALVAKSNQAIMVKTYLDEIDTLTKTENSTLTAKQREYCVPILHAFVKRVIEDNIDPQAINATNFLEQTKHFARLGLSIQDKEMYIDFRKNKKTNKVDCTIMKQYQGIQKEMVKFCSKPIIRFLDGVVCNGDTFVEEIDFSNGLTKIVKHIKNEKIDRNRLGNIIKSYAIAYCSENGTIVPYTCVIDKNRILRAYNASPTDTKTIWNQDTSRMVVKTAYWVLFNSVMKPFINIPADLKVDWEATNEKMVWEDAQVEQQEQTEYDLPSQSLEVEDGEIDVKKVGNATPIEEIPLDLSIDEDFVE